MGADKAPKTGPTFSKPPYQLTWEQVAEELGTNIETGLSSQQVDEHLAKYGENKLEGEGVISPWKILIKQTTNAMILYVFFLVRTSLELAVCVARGSAEVRVY
jgi:Na+-exporting ATPase